MPRQLPSLTGLQCFDAAARHLNFTRAAEELNLTQSAVSRQIRNLEGFLRQELFVREKRRLSLTREGELYARKMGDLLYKMEMVTIHIMTINHRDYMLTVGTIPSFGSCWLTPRLSDFSRCHPKIRLNLVSQIPAFDFAHQEVDVAIQYGQGDWNGVIADLLIEEDVIVVGAPSLIKGALDLDPGEAKRFPMLHVASRPNAWTDWLDAKKCTISSANPGPTFEQWNMLVQACLAGMGLAVMPTIFSDSELETGQLVAPFGGPVKSGSGYYLAYPEAAAGVPKIAVFRKWILGVAAGT